MRGPRGRHGVYARAVGSYVPDLTKKAFQKFGFSAAKMLTEWSDIVGRDLAACTRPERLKWPRRPDAIDEAAPPARTGATLVLRVEPARALDVQYQAGQLRDRINAYFGYCAVTEIRILQAPVVTAEPPRATAMSATTRRAQAPKDAVASDTPAPSNRLAAALERLGESVRQSGSNRQAR